MSGVLNFGGRGPAGVAGVSGGRLIIPSPFDYPDDREEMPGQLKSIERQFQWCDWPYNPNDFWDFNNGVTICTPAPLMNYFRYAIINNFMAIQFQFVATLLAGSFPAIKVPANQNVSGPGLVALGQFLYIPPAAPSYLIGFLENVDNWIYPYTAVSGGYAPGVYAYFKGSIMIAVR